mgnify:FL=1
MILKKVVAYYIRLCGTNDPWKMAKMLGIHIAVLPMGNVLGKLPISETYPMDFINEDILDNEVLLRVVMAHELGHALLHCKENCCFMAHHTLLLTSRVERQANEFAAYLLIADDMLQEYAGYTREQFCQCTGYPEELIELRLK